MTPWDSAQTLTHGGSTYSRPTVNTLQRSKRELREALGTFHGHPNWADNPKRTLLTESPTGGR